MPALICGSIAYDNIMVFPDRFKNHILPEKIHILNVSFMVPEMRREPVGRMPARGDPPHARFADITQLHSAEPPSAFRPVEF